ncbi:MAG TPA: YraN family protein [Candidatus Omnitrophota bacterium]|nr:YraN family protein [Candidatus Omnitrophota bacterium]
MKLSPNPRPFHLSLGDRGETVACDFLRKEGYEIVQKNYKCKLGEIDVVAKRRGRIAFVEIKTRTSVQFGSPQEAVNFKKQEKLAKLAEWYLKEKKITNSPIAFDVVAVHWEDGKRPLVRLIKDAFEKDDKEY